ncbi:hypothetical protein EfmGK941_16910 [Enterococcus faecium]|nr:hypothetical protein EfmGK941_16910 [Enterococcus faecium]
MNYQWPVAFSLLTFYPFFQLLRGEEINARKAIEQYCQLKHFPNVTINDICFFVLTSIVSLYLIVNGRYNYKLSVFSIISLAELIFSLTTPGNALRAAHEINKWFPEYKNFNFLNKLDLGISSFGKPFFLALCQMMLVKRNLRIIWTEQKEENLFLFCLFG